MVNIEAKCRSPSVCKWRKPKGPLQNYVGARLRHCAALEILMYPWAPSDSCAPRGLHSGILATFFNKPLGE